MTVRVTDHALVRFLERAGGLDVEGLRASIAASLERAATAAALLGADEVDVHADGLVYVVRDGTVITITRDGRRR